MSSIDSIGLNSGVGAGWLGAGACSCCFGCAGDSAGSARRRLGRLRAAARRLGDGLLRRGVSRRRFGGGAVDHGVAIAAADQSAQAEDQRLGIGLRLAVGLDLADHLREHVEAVEQHVDGGAVDAAGALAQQREDVFHRVCQRGDGVVAHRRGHALDRVGDAEDLVERLAVVGAGLQRDDGRIQRLEVLSRLGEKQLYVLGVVDLARRHMSSGPISGSTTLRKTNGRTRSSPSSAGCTIISVEPSTSMPPGSSASARIWCTRSRRSRSK